MFRIEVVIAPGPTNKGQPMGTAPTDSFIADFSSHPPIIRSLIATIKSKMPPAIIKLSNEIPNSNRMFCPISVNKVNRSNPTIIANLKVFLRSEVSMSWVKLIKIGTLPNGLTTINNAIDILIKSYAKTEKSISKIM
jgi:hypothetical protein